MQTVFITAGSGHIGTQLIPLLLLHPDLHLVLPTSNASKLQALYPQSEKITALQGSIQDPQWVEAQLRAYSCTTVFLCLTGADELMTTLNFFSAIKRSPCVKHIVYLSAGADLTSTALISNSQTWLAGHAVVKLPLELCLRDLEPERLTYTILGPTLFFVNDVRQKMGIVKAGVYPEGLGPKGASRVAVGDIARAVEICVLDQGKRWGGKKIMLGSRKRYTVGVKNFLALMFAKLLQATFLLRHGALYRKTISLEFGLKQWASRSNVHQLMMRASIRT